MTNRIIVAKPGFDAVTELNPRNKIFDSQYDSLKYHLSGEKTVSVTGNGTFVEEVVHGLDYAPFFIAYVNRFSAAGASGWSLCPGSFSALGAYIQATAYVDATKIYFQVVRLDSLSGDFNFKYKIFRNRLGL